MPDWCKKGGSKGYMVVKPLQWEMGKKGSGHWITVPLGFAFDSSVPWVFRWFWSVHDPYYLKAAAIHDYLLEDGYRVHEADAAWQSAALSVHAPEMKTRLANFGMRLRRLWQWVWRNK